MVIDKKISGKAVDWLTSQTFNNILLLLILGSIMWAGWYSITTAIPSHLRQIQNGYESIDQAHQKERKQTVEIYDKWMSEITNRSGRSQPASTPTSVPTLSRTP